MIKPEDLDPNSQNLDSWPFPHLLLLPGSSFSSNVQRSLKNGRPRVFMSVMGLKSVIFRACWASVASRGHLKEMPPRDAMTVNFQKTVFFITSLFELRFLRGFRQSLRNSIGYHLIFLNISLHSMRTFH